jgi:crossover junction endodeoxyribonuclease RuvC
MQYIGYLGIDPGQSGAIVLMEEGGVTFFPMPDTEPDMLALFRQISCKPVVALIERVGPMPKQGVVSVWTFAANYYGLRMALHASGIPFDDILPRKWQQEIGVHPIQNESKSEHKRRLRAKAQCLFPKLTVTLATADALLLAELCRRRYQVGGA